MPDLTVHRDVFVELRDGVGLATDVYRPAGSAPVPAVLHRSPYGKDVGLPLADLARMVGAGYAVVTQDVRGRGRSEGRFEPFVQERDDGHDTIRWVATQPWCTGAVVMAGPSYLGATQWLAAAGAPDALAAIAPQFTSASYHDGWCYQGGALQLGFLLCWALGNLALPASRRPGAPPGAFEAVCRAIDDIESGYRRWPFEPPAVLDELVPQLREWLDHPDDGPYWEQTAPNRRYDAVGVPALNVGGWYDCFLRGTLENHVEMSRRRRSDPARQPRLVVGPWAHGQVTGDFAEVSFGPLASAGAIDVVGRQLRFFDRCLGRAGDHGHHGDDGDDGPPVVVFVMGTDRWIGLGDWPPPEAVAERWYLGSVDGGGVLSTACVDDDVPRVYRHDPADPVPTVGGATFLPGYPISANAGPRDQRALDDRPDVLTYVSEPLSEPRTVIGPVRITVFLSSTATDTDVCAKLVDVHPDGRALLVTDGVLRGRYRRGLDQPVPLEPGGVHRFDVDLGATAHTFRAGHRLRIDVASSNFPRFDRTPAATNAVHHGSWHPSAVVLPVVDEAIVAARHLGPHL